MQGDIGALERRQDNYRHRGFAPIRLLPIAEQNTRPHKARRGNFSKVHNYGHRQASDAILVGTKLTNMDYKIKKLDAGYGVFDSNGKLKFIGMTVDDAVEEINWLNGIDDLWQDGQ